MEKKKRFEAVPQSVTEQVQKVREGYFNFPYEMTVMVLFDTKMRKSSGRLVLGRMQKCNDLLRKLTDNLAETGCDYIMFLDKVAFESMEDADRVRLIRHEFRHCKIVYGDAEIKYDLYPHDLEDFVAEVKLNEDDPGWATRVSEITRLIYAQMADGCDPELAQQNAKELAKRAA